MALDTLFETPPPLVSSENKESQNLGSEREDEEEGEILEDGEVSDDADADVADAGDGADEGGGTGEGEQNTEDQGEESYIEAEGEGGKQEAGNEEEEVVDEERERRHRRKRKKEKHSRRHHKKSKRRKRHRSHSEEDGSPPEERGEEGRFLERSFPPRKRRSVHKEKRRPTSSDHEQTWSEKEEVVPPRRPSGSDDHEEPMQERVPKGRGRRLEKKGFGRGADFWRMGEEADRGGDRSSGEDSWEEAMRRHKAHQEGYLDDSEEEMPYPKPPPRGRGRGKPDRSGRSGDKPMRGGRGGRGGRGRGRGRGKDSRSEEPKMMLHLICKFYLEGRCKKGENCTYSHDLSQQRKQELCKFYISGFCNKGDSCLFMHGDFPCKYFHTGAECFQGDNCRFSHAPLTPDTRMLLEKSLSSFNKHEERSPSKTKGLLPTPGDTNTIPSLLDIDVGPVGDFEEMDIDPSKMSFYGAKNPDYSQEQQHHGPPPEMYDDHYQDQDQYQGQYQDQDQYQEQGPYREQDRYEDNDRYHPSTDPGPPRDTDCPRQQEQAAREAQILPSSQTEDVSTASDKDTAHSESPPQQMISLLPRPQEPSTKDTMPDVGSQSDSSQTNEQIPPKPAESKPSPLPPSENPQPQSELPPAVHGSPVPKPHVQQPPVFIPARQKALFMRIQQKQLHDGQSDVDTTAARMEESKKREHSREDDSWYSSDEEDDSKKQNNNLAMQTKTNSNQSGQSGAQNPNAPAMSAETIKSLSTIELPSALANLFAGTSSLSSGSTNSGSQVTLNLLDLVKKGPSLTAQQSTAVTSPITEILDSPLSPTNEEFRLIEVICEPGRKDPRAGREKRDKSDMRFRVLHWKDNKYSINDPEERPSLQPIELHTPTELKSQPNFPKSKESALLGPIDLQSQASNPRVQGPVDPRANRPSDPRLARLQDSQTGPQGPNMDGSMNTAPKDPRTNRDPRAMAAGNMSHNLPNVPLPPLVELGLDSLLPTPEGNFRPMAPMMRPPMQGGLLPLPPRPGQGPPMNPRMGPPHMHDPHFMRGPPPQGMVPPFHGPRPPRGDFPPDMPPPHMGMRHQGPPFRGPGPGPGPRLGAGPRPLFNRPPMMRQMSDGVNGPPNFQNIPNFPSGPPPLIEQGMQRYRGPAPGDPRTGNPPNNPRTASKDPRNLDPRQAPQDPRDPRIASTESRDPRQAADSRDPRLVVAESRDPRLARQMSGSNTGSNTPPQTVNPQTQVSQDLAGRINPSPNEMDNDPRRQSANRKGSLQGFSIPKLQKRADVADTDTSANDNVESFGGSGGMEHRKVPSAHHSMPHAVSSFDVGSKIRPNFAGGNNVSGGGHVDPRTNTIREPPSQVSVQMPGNGQGDGGMNVNVAPLSEPEIQLKDMFKTQDPTASPFC